MIYTKLTKKAIRVAFDAHIDQKDKAGLPYIYHPLHLAEQMTDEVTTCVALLHDVIEDTSLTFDDLIREGFPEEVLDALHLLTHDPSVDYMDYVAEIKKNPVATAVKLADLAHNSDTTRLDVVDDKAIERVEKYAKCIAFLKGEE